MTLGPTGRKLSRATPAEDELVSSGQFTWQQLRKMAGFLRSRLHANGTLLRFAQDLDIACERWVHSNFEYRRKLNDSTKPKNSFSARDGEYEPDCIYCKERYKV